MRFFTEKRMHLKTRTRKDTEKRSVNTTNLSQNSVDKLFAIVYN